MRNAGETLLPRSASTPTAKAISVAIGIAQPLKARLLLVHVVQDLAWLVEMASVASSDEMHREMFERQERGNAEQDERPSIL